MFAALAPIAAFIARPASKMVLAYAGGVATGIFAPKAIKKIKSIVSSRRGACTTTKRR